MTCSQVPESFAVLRRNARYDGPGWATSAGSLSPQALDYRPLQRSFWFHPHAASMRPYNFRVNNGVVAYMVDSRIYSVVAVIRRGDLFLAVSRKVDHEDLGLPGGKVERSESPEQALVRELLEETGLATSRRHLRSTFVASDERGRPCMAFEVSSYKGSPRSLEGAWVDWVPPARLLAERCTFRAYNALLFAKLGVSVADAPPLPAPKGLTLETGLEELTGLNAFPRGHITVLFGPAASLFRSADAVHQGLTFRPQDFAGLKAPGLLSIAATQRASLVPDHLQAYVRSLGNQCKAAILVTSLHRPAAGWTCAASNVIECRPHALGTQLTLVKGEAATQPVGTAVVVAAPAAAATP